MESRAELDELARRARGLPALAAYLKEIELAAAQARSRPVPALPFSAYRAFDETGDRLGFEDRYFERRRALVATALASWIWGRPEDLAALEDQAWAICDEYSWALPAHLEGRSLDPSSIAASSARRFLDLFACETAFALAEIAHLLEDRLTPAVAARARREVEERVLAPFLDRAEPWPWELMKNNWCAVCAGSIGAAAIYLVRDRVRLGAVLARVRPTLDRFLEGFSEDGACLEGLGYWTYGLGFYVAFAELAEGAGAGLADLMPGERFRRVAAFQASCYLTDSLALSFSDCSSRERYRIGLSAFLARRLPGIRTPPAGLAAGFVHDRCGRWCLSFRDIAWTAGFPVPPRGEDAEARSAAWFPEAQWLVYPASSASSLAFAAKGGRNDEPHNHNDLGSFVLALGDRELLADLGAGEYTRDYFGEGRYGVLCNSSLGHSLPILDGRGQLPGPDRRARVLSFRREGRAVSLRLGIESAYDSPSLVRLTRSFDFDGSARLVVEDEFEFASPCELIERFVTRLPASLLRPSGEEGAYAMDAGKGPGGEDLALAISVSTPGGRSLLRIHEHREHDGGVSSIPSLDYAFRPGAGTFVFRIDFLLVIA